MFSAAALFAGAKLLQKRNNNENTNDKSSINNNSNSQEALLHQRLTKSICGQKMDSNPRQLSLKSALKYDELKKAAGENDHDQKLSDNSIRQTNSASESQRIQIIESRKAFDEVKSRARDLSDIIALAESPSISSSATTSSASNSIFAFSEQVNDLARQIRISTKTFSTFPVDMVKAVVYIPIAPQDFLKMLELEKRATWDEHFRGGEVLYKDGVPNADDFTIKTMRFDAFPNLVRPREFEMAVHTKVDPVTGNAYVKAISTLFEFGAKTSDSAVRGFIPLSGFVVRPVNVNEEVCREIMYEDESDAEQKQNISEKNAASSDDKTKKNEKSKSSFFSKGNSLIGQVRQLMPKRSSSNADASSKNKYGHLPPLFPSTTIHSEVTYVALVHPRGSIPVMLLNLVIGKQTASMKGLQGAALKMSLSKQKKEMNLRRSKL